MRSLILGWDFDDTIVKTEWPEIKHMLSDGDGYTSKQCINDLYRDGHQIIIWTCRTDHTQEQAQEWLDANGIKYHRINQNCPDLCAFYGNDSRKIGADFYIDDKGILGLPSYRSIYQIITERALKEV